MKKSVALAAVCSLFQGFNAPSSNKTEKNGLVKSEHTTPVSGLTTSQSSQEEKKPICFDDLSFAGYLQVLKMKGEKRSYEYIKYLIAEDNLGDFFIFYREYEQQWLAWFSSVAFMKGDHEIVKKIADFCKDTEARAKREAMIQQMQTEYYHKFLKEIKKSA